MGTLLSVSEHYFSEDTVADEGRQRLLRISLRNHELQMWVSDRVFSASKLDPGTAELLRALPPLPESGTFLDLGCGWGVVAVSAAVESPDAEVWAVDVNPRALKLTEHNAAVNGATNVTVLPAETALALARERGIAFDRIISNPPVRIGKTRMHAMLSDWLTLLSPGGQAWLVMGKNLGGDSLVKWLRDQGYDAKKVSSRKGYRIISVEIR